MSDIVQRSKAALSGVTEGEWVQVGLGNIQRLPVGDHPPVAKTWRQSDGDFVAEARSLVPELIAEVEKLRAAGPWVEHVEYQLAMKRERDGECICNTGPDTDGPDEFCPWHGRRYTELVDIIVRQQAEINGLT